MDISRRVSRKSSADRNTKNVKAATPGFRLTLIVAAQFNHPHHPVGREIAENVRSVTVNHALHSKSLSPATITESRQSCPVTDRKGFGKNGGLLPTRLAFK
jgi:hypothetical protein